MSEKLDLNHAGDMQLRVFITKNGHFYAIYNEDFWGDFQELESFVQEAGYELLHYVPVKPQFRKSTGTNESINEFGDSEESYEEDSIAQEEAQSNFEESCDQYVLGSLTEFNLPHGVLAQDYVLLMIKPKLKAV